MVHMQLKALFSSLLVHITTNLTQTLRKADVRKLEAFEMWVWRRMKRVKWTDLRT